MPEGDANPKAGANLLFGVIFAKNCMEMKKIELREGHASLEP